MPTCQKGKHSAQLTAPPLQVHPERPVRRVGVTFGTFRPSIIVSTISGASSINCSSGLACAGSTRYAAADVPIAT